MKIDLKCLKDVVIAFDLGIADFQIIQEVYFEIIDTLADGQVLKEPMKFLKLAKIENALYKTHRNFFIAKNVLTNELKIEYV